jgi:hypothetical protein
MKTNTNSVYGTFTTAMKSYIDENGGLNRTITRAQLVEVYKKQIKENIKNVKGYRGQSFYEGIPLSVASFIRNYKGERIGYVKTKNNRTTGIWKFPEFNKNI